VGAYAKRQKHFAKHKFILGERLGTIPKKKLNGRTPPTYVPPN
jgi:hypothetical protein